MQLILVVSLITKLGLSLVYLFAKVSVTLCKGVSLQPTETQDSGNTTIRTKLLQCVIYQ